MIFVVIIVVVTAVVAYSSSRVLRACVYFVVAVAVAIAFRVHRVHRDCRLFVFGASPLSLLRCYVPRCRRFIVLLVPRAVVVVFISFVHGTMVASL